MEGTTAFQPPGLIQRLSMIFNEVATGHTVARKNSFARSLVIGVRCTWTAGDIDADTPPSDDEESAELHTPSMQAAATTAPKPLISVQCWCPPPVTPSTPTEISLSPAIEARSEFR